MTEAIDYHEREAKIFKVKYLKKKSFKTRLQVWEGLIMGLTTPVNRSMDLGCGPGWMTRLLCVVSKDVVAIDGSKQMITQCRETLGEDVDQVEFRNASITPQLMDSWTPESFDLIISSSVLEYVANADQVLAKSYSLLSSNGTMIFSLPNKESLFRAIERRLFIWFGRPRYRGLLINVWSRDGSIKVLKQIGFKVEEIQFQGYVPIFSEFLFWLPGRYIKPMMIIVAKK